MGCSICGGMGFIPFKNKQGKIEPHIRLYCNCHDEPEHYQPLRPEDIDYPVSYPVWRGMCQEHGWSDPGPCQSPPVVEQPSPETSRVVVYEHSDLSENNLKRLSTLEMQIQAMRVKPTPTRKADVKNNNREDITDRFYR